MSKSLAVAEFAGILCVEQGSAYETSAMLSYRAWMIAKHVYEDPKIDNASLDLFRKTTHLESCAKFIGCQYELPRV